MPNDSLLLASASGKARSQPGSILVLQFCVNFANSGKQVMGLAIFELPGTFECYSVLYINTPRCSLRSAYDFWNLILSRRNYQKPEHSACRAKYFVVRWHNRRCRCTCSKWGKGLFPLSNRAKNWFIVEHQWKYGRDHLTYGCTEKTCRT